MFTCREGLELMLLPQFAKMSLLLSALWKSVNSSLTGVARDASSKLKRKTFYSFGKNLLGKNPQRPELTQSCLSLMEGTMPGWMMLGEFARLLVCLVLVIRPVVWLPTSSPKNTKNFPFRSKNSLRIGPKSTRVKRQVSLFFTACQKYAGIRSGPIKSVWENLIWEKLVWKKTTAHWTHTIKSCQWRESSSRTELVAAICFIFLQAYLIYTDSLNWHS